ncbi:hypothetical protein [Haloechinothrix salitolerans]|uniref:DUF222 domain-containing protein n=1 Tax=Haloechinothrix salitolerans TaxID=926830 RepID=A0ABW2C0S7_9PSEU
MSSESVQLNDRERATLRAVGVGRAEITCSAEPDLFIDGLACCDQGTARRLAHLRLVVPRRSGRTGERVPAALSDAARAMLGLVSEARDDAAA